ncbi:MAG: glycine betaine ABC transporter substrate-binding protein [Mycobacterium sp.]
MNRARSRLGLVLGLLATALLTACGGAPAPDTSIAVGARPDPESQVLAYLYAGALRSSGTQTRVEVLDDPVDGLDSASVTVVPGFTGRFLTTFQPGAAELADEDVYQAMLAALPEGVAAGDYGPAQDKPALAVTERTAERWGDADLAVLARHCVDLTLGSSGADDPAKVGACRLPTARVFDDTAVLFNAVRAGQVELAWTSTADPSRPDDIVVLTDDTPLLRAENVVPLYRRNVLTEPQLLAVNRIAGELDTAGLTDLRRAVASGVAPSEAADAWLAEHPVGH